MKPLVSIITVVLNGEKYLEEAILSVVSQTYQNIEYIVIDGGSVDSTISIIEKYKSSIDFFVSEPDQGISDAFNKGISNAHGDYILFMNADDFYLSNEAIEGLVFGGYDIMVTRVVYSMGSGKYKIKCGFSKVKLMLGIGYAQPGMVYNAEMFRAIGGFSHEYKYAMDTELLLRAIACNYKVIGSEQSIAVMRIGGLSSINVDKVIKEGGYARSEYISMPLGQSYVMIRRLYRCCKSLLLKVLCVLWRD